MTRSPFSFDWITIGLATALFLMDMLLLTSESRVTIALSIWSMEARTMKIGIGNDHTAVEYKQAIAQHIRDTYGYEVVNYGTDSTESFDYPIAGEAVANAVKNGEVDLGVAICGTGIGISRACNKVHGIRCAVCSEPYSAQLSRRNNNSNILAFGARVVGIEMAKMIVDAWLTAKFEGGRHQRRVDMIMAIEDKQ